MLRRLDFLRAISIKLHAGPCIISKSLVTNVLRYTLKGSHSFFKKILRHWSYKEDGVIVKLTNVTLEHKSGVNLALEFLVIINIEKFELKSIS